MKKQTLRKISTCLSAAIIACSLSCGFADTPLPNDNQGSESNEAQTVSVNISANYFDNGDGSYKIIISSLDKLAEYKNFGFTVKLSDDYAKSSKITSSTFAEALEAPTSVISASSLQAKFEGGSPESLLSGKLTLCTVNIKSDSAPIDGKILFSDFSALDSDGKEVKFAPVLTVSQGPVVAELTESEQNIYDSLLALPSANDLSFYAKSEDEESIVLADVESVFANIKSVKKSYDSLTNEQKKKISDNLDYNEKTMPDLTLLYTVSETMKDAEDIINLAFNLPTYDEENISKLTDRLFIFNIYNSKTKSTVATLATKLTDKPKTELETATASIDEKYTKANTAYTALDFGDKFDTLDREIALVQTMSDDRYYEDYLADLLTQAKKVKTEISKLPDTDRYKEYHLKEVETYIEKITVIQNGVKELPVFELSDIDYNFSYSVTVTRKSGNTPTAEIRVDVYDKDNNKIDTKTEEFKKGETEHNVELLASAADNYPTEENIKVFVYYILEGAEFELGSKTGYVSFVVDTNKRPSSGGSSSSSTSSSSDNNATSGGTKFPTVDEDDEPDIKPIESEEILFTDLKGYDWAKEAIEGLYYAGIVNGMEEDVFNPAGSVTREQFCKMAVQLFGVLNYDTKTSFVDVKEDAWYAPYITSAINAGYIQGQSNEYFGVGESIMRQDMATILFRALGNKNSAAVLDFTDTDSIASYANEAVSELVGLKIINGYEDGSFKPRGTATRAEAAKMIWGVYNLIND